MSIAFLSGDLGLNEAILKLLISMKLVSVDPASLRRLLRTMLAFWPIGDLLAYSALKSIAEGRLLDEK